MKMNDKMPYMEVLFNKIYDNKVISGIFDDDRIVSILSLGIRKKIIKDLVKDIPRNAHVLQIGLTFGNQINELYEKICSKGKLDIYDVSEVQILRAKEKYSHHNIEISNYSATLSWDEKYDVILCYNLLHELPLKTRQMVMDNILNGLAKGGKAVFVDYAEPSWWNPLKWPMFVFNRLYQPFAESIWEKPLESFVSNKNDYRWQKVYYRGKMYQKVVATKKILSNEDAKKLTKLFRDK